jgi:hypothetical protein
MAKSMKNEVYNHVLIDDAIKPVKRPQHGLFELFTTDLLDFNGQQSTTSSVIAAVTFTCVLQTCRP